jgi:hypothetical protein
MIPPRRGRDCSKETTNENNDGRSQRAAWQVLALHFFTKLSRACARHLAAQSRVTRVLRFIFKIWEGTSMSEISKAPADQSKRAKSSINWPVLIAAGICIVFVVGVWVNNYRVSQATANPAPITAKK